MVWIAKIKVNTTPIYAGDALVWWFGQLPMAHSIISASIFE